MSLRWHGTRAELHAALKELPAVLSGKVPDPLGLGRVFLGVIANELLELITEAFLVKSRGGVGDDGQRWAELKESTLERRRAKGIDHERVLEETGELLKSLQAVGDDPDSQRPAHQVFDIVIGAATVGTAVEYSDRHQKGTEYMPARRIVPPDGDLPPAWERRLEVVGERALDKVLEVMCERSRG